MERSKSLDDVHNELLGYRCFSELTKNEDCLFSEAGLERDQCLIYSFESILDKEQKNWMRSKGKGV